jgi:hypothetical protein
VPDWIFVNAYLGFKIGDEYGHKFASALKLQDFLQDNCYIENISQSDYNELHKLALLRNKYRITCESLFVNSKLKQLATNQAASTLKRLSSQSLIDVLY